MIEADQNEPSPAGAIQSKRPTLGRVLAITAPIVFTVSLVVSILINGAPIARDQMFLWLLLGMAAFSISAWRRWGLMPSRTSTFTAWISRRGITTSMR